MSTSEAIPTPEDRIQQIATQIASRHNPIAALDDFERAAPEITTADSARRLREVLLGMHVSVLSRKPFDLDPPQRADYMVIDALSCMEGGWHSDMRFAFDRIRLEHRNKEEKLLGGLILADQYRQKTGKDPTRRDDAQESAF